MGTDFL